MNTRLRRGAQPGNSNGIRHGLFSQFDKLSSRTAPSRAIAAYESELLKSLGTELTTQERLLVRRAAVACFRLAILDQRLIGCPMEFDTLEEWRLRWSRELRDTLKILGLKQPPKPVETITD
jgi:hypothetical protein